MTILIFVEFTSLPNKDIEMKVYVISWSLRYEYGGTDSVYFNKDSADKACETLNKEDDEGIKYWVEEYRVKE